MSHRYFSVSIEMDDDDGYLPESTVILKALERFLQVSYHIKTVVVKLEHVETEQDADVAGIRSLGDGSMDEPS